MRTLSGKIAALIVFTFWLVGGALLLAGGLAPL